MPDTSPASDAGVGAEALLGLASGHRVRLPSVCSLPDATEPSNSTHTFHPPPQRNSFLPSPPLHLPDPPPPPIHPLPTPSANLRPPTTKRLPTLAEWAPIPLQPLHPPHPSPERPWSSSSNLPAPYAYTHSQLPWTPHPRPHQFQQPQQTYYSYPNPQPLPSPRNLNSPALHTNVNPLPPPFALPVPRTDVATLRPCVPHIPALDHLCKAAAANVSSSSLRSIAAAQSSPHPSPVIAPSLHPPTFNAPLESCLDIVEQPATPPVRARGLADLINPTDSSPATTDNASNLIHTPIVSRSSYELSEEQAAPPLSLPLLQIRPICGSNQPLIPESSQFFENTPETMGRKSAKKKTTSPDAAFTPSVPISHSTSVPKSAKPDRKSTSSTPESTSSKREQCNGTEDSPNENDFTDNPETEITRCPCGSSESSGFMIACDDCNTWQHSRCMGYRRRSDLPEKYYCNLCRPEKMRIGCIAHPRYRDRNGKDREGREVKRDQEGLLAAVKPTELRKIFLADFKHKKSLLSAGKDHMLMKYASLMKIQFSKHRQGVVDGLTVLLDMPCSNVSDKLDLALHKLRQPSENDVATERRGGGSMSVSDFTYKESLPRSAINGRVGSKRQRSQAGSSESPEELSPLAPENSQPIEHAVEIDTSDLGSARGMSREERKLRETMKLFARMEERERDRKRPRVGDNFNSPKSGLQSRPKTPRTGSRTTSKPGTPNALVDWDDRKSRTIADLDEISSGCAETSRNQDGDDDDNALSPTKDENVAISEKTSKYDNGRHSHKSTSSWKSEVETGTGTFKRDRSKSERSALRRRDSADTSSPTGAKRQLMSERTRSHDMKRRKIGTRDSYARGVKDEPKREARINFSLHVPGPTVLSSKLVPECRLSQLELEARKQSDEEGSDNARTAHIPFKKNDAVRQEHLPWQLKLIEATPVKKRVRIPLAETKVNIVDSACGNDGNINLPNDNVKKHSLGVIDSAEHISEPNAPCNKVGEWKKFCLKKRRAMLDIPLTKGDASSPHSKNLVVSDELAIISPVSPGGLGTSSTPSSDAGKIGLTPDTRASSRLICSPKLRSSPIGGTPIPRLRSVPPPAVKRARSSATTTPSKCEQNSELEGRSSMLVSNVERITVNTAKKGLHPGNGIRKTDLYVTEVQDQRSNGTYPSDEAKDSSNRKRGSIGEQEAPKCETEVSSKRSKSMSCSKKPIVIPLSKPAPSVLDDGTRLRSERADTPRKSQSSGTGISIRSVPISQMTDIGRLTDSDSKRRQVVSNEASKTEPKKAVEGTIDILQHRLERFANPAVNGGNRTDSLKCLNGTVDTVGVDGVAVGVQTSIGASSITTSEKFRRGGDVRGFSVDGCVNSDKPTGDTQEGWKDNAWSSGALPSFASHKRTHGYHHASSRLNRTNDVNGGSSNGGGVSGYGLGRTDEERKDWTRGHEPSYRGGLNYGWGDGAGRNGRRRR